MLARLWLCAAVLVAPLSLSAQNYRVTTVAGFGTFGGDGGPAVSALLFPGPVAVDATGISGASVMFAASATDLVDGSVAVTGAPPGGIAMRAWTS